MGFEHGFQIITISKLRVAHCHIINRTSVDQDLVH